MVIINSLLPAVIIPSDTLLSPSLFRYISIQRAVSPTLCWFEAMPDGQLYNRNNSSFRCSLRDIDRDSTTDINPVKVLWTTILASWFPTTTCIFVMKANPSSDCITITVKQVSENASKQLVTRSILKLVCKSLSNDRPTEWQECTNSNGPLVDSLEKIETDSMILGRDTSMNNTADKRLYTALAIGAKVKFFRWSRGGAQQQQQQFKELHSGILDLTTNDGRVDLEATLAEVSRNGWDWAQ